MSWASDQIKGASSVFFLPADGTSVFFLLPLVDTKVTVGMKAGQYTLYWPLHADAACVDLGGAIVVAAWSSTSEEEIAV